VTAVKEEQHATSHSARKPVGAPGRLRLLAANAPEGLADSELVCDGLAASEADTLGEAVSEPLAVTVEDGVGVGVPVLLGELLPDSLGLPVPLDVPLGDADTDAEGEPVPAVPRMGGRESADRVAGAHVFNFGVPLSQNHDRRSTGDGRIHVQTCSTRCRNTQQSLAFQPNQ